MDDKTKLLMAIEAILIVVLVAVVAMDYNSVPTAAEAIMHEDSEASTVAKAEEASDAAPAKVAEKAAPAKEEKKHAAKAEEKKEKKHAAKAEEKKEKKHAAKAEEKKEKKHVAKAEGKKEKKHVAKAEEKKEKKHVAKAEKKAKAAKASAKAASAGHELIAFNNPAYEHKKPIVQFTHKKHIENYGISCGECHHDDSGAPIEDLTMDSDVQGCFDCHDKPGKAPKEVKGADKLQYHVNALHANCIGCHKAYNKKKGDKAAPQSCSKCHIKKG